MRDMTPRKPKPFTDQLRDAADNINTLPLSEIAALLRRAALRLDERDRLLKEVRDGLVGALEELPPEGNG